MAILGKNQTNTKPELEGIPPMLQRTKGNGHDVEALLARIAQLEAQVQRKSTLVLNVSEKGAVSLYGMGRFPMTLYAQQWEKVLDMGDSIREFIAANKDRLSTK